MADEQVEQSYSDFEKMMSTIPGKMVKVSKIKYAEAAGDRFPVKEYHVPILRYLSFNDGATQKEVNATVPLDKSRISVIINELISMGYITDTGEGRTSCLHLTEEGRLNGDLAWKYAREAQENVLNVFTPEDRKVIREYFMRLNGRLDEILSQQRR